MLRAAAGIAVTHERFRDVAVSALGVASQRIEVIRDWCRDGPLPTFDRAAERLRLGWAADETVVVQAGGLGRPDRCPVLEAARIADREQAGALLA